jgi:hypothetical protein
MHVPRLARRDAVLHAMMHCDKIQSYPGKREVAHPPSQVEKKSFGDRIVWANSWCDENVPVFKLFAHTIRSPDFFFDLGVQCRPYYM